MMKEITINKNDLRKILLYYQGLLIPQYFGKEGVLSFIKRVGCIQYDPISRIAKNADLVLQSRIADYKESYLYELLYKERLLVDGPDKKLAIHLMEDYPYMEPIRKKDADSRIRTMEYRNTKESLLLLDEIIDEIDKRGPLQPKDLLSKKSKKGLWGSSKLSTVAMDYLWSEGSLAIYDKAGVIRVFDLKEKTIPKKYLTTSIEFKQEEFISWYIMRRLGSVGIFWNKESIVWDSPYLKDSNKRTRVISQLLEQEQLIKVNVIECKVPLYIRKQDIELLDIVKEDYKKEVHFLAPLDNLLWDRDFISEIFGFDYTWEVYKPIDKRIYGYYVLPVIYGDCFIGRFDSIFHRKENRLEVINWYFEEGVEIDDECFNEIIKAFSRFTMFLNAKPLTIKHIEKIVKN